jgi:lipopolysaccharide/colanic/teichoic acid biosynthesis glycosyltransferase
MSAIPHFIQPVVRHAPSAHAVRRGSARLRLVEPPPRTITYIAPELSPVHEIARRLLNIAVAAMGLALAGPIMLAVALAVKLTSPGPVIYTQVRVGHDRRRRGVSAGAPRRANDLGGKPFRILKFRTMRVDAERTSGAVWASQNDSRLTSIGGFLRKYRLDELPQLVNVLRGDMNIVGPRPERPSIFLQLSRCIPQYEARQLVRPGITGLAQVSQQYDQCLDDVRNKLRYDLEYLRCQSLVEDVRIMAKTVPVVLFRRGGW